MSLPTQPYKGARDFYPEDKRLQKYIFGVMRKVCESYGYEEYDAPILELTELYVSKTSDEIVNEQTYTFTDRGGRSVTIRPEMTPSVSRMVAAKRNELVYPVRWYSIPNFWRYERPQRGRLREFWQLNVDVFGISGIEAELEIINVSDTIMQTFGAKRDMYTIKINSRKLMDYLIKEVLAMDGVQAATLSHLIDKMHKMDYGEFAGQVEGLFNPGQRDKGSADRLFEFLKINSLAELPPYLANHDSVKELNQLIKLLNDFGVTNVEFDPTLMRGFDYYTDIVFEVFDTHPDNNRAMFGGGRYDGLLAEFGVAAMPTVGFGMGDVTLVNFLELHELMPTLKPEADVFAILIGDVFQPAQKIIGELRQMGVNVVTGNVDLKTEKQIKSAVKRNIRYALFIGAKELETEQFILRNLDSNSEENHSLQRIVSIVRDYRKK
jgi:histidyl-tRNA synthetase